MGFGCTNGSVTQGDNAPITPTSAVQSPTQLKTNNAPIGDTAPGGSIVLNAKATGDNTVEFEWNLGSDLASTTEGFRFARGIEENPTYPSSWWWERGPSHRSLTWNGLPDGAAHYRVCAVVDDACAVYSNDVSVDVQGEAEDVVNE